MMRVISGEYRGIRLRAPRGTGTRPPTGRVRESIFSALGGEGEGSGHPGSLCRLGQFRDRGLSRGGRSAVFVERSRPALAALRSNLETVGAADAAEVVSSSVERYLANHPEEGRFNIVFADPPWDISSEDLAAVLQRVSAG